MFISYCIQALVKDDFVRGGELLNFDGVTELERVPKTMSEWKQVRESLSKQVAESNDLTFVSYRYLSYCPLNSPVASNA